MTIDYSDHSDSDSVYRRNSKMIRSKGTATLTIDEDADASDSLDVSEAPNVSFGFPAEMNGTEITFEQSFDGGSTWKTTIDAAGAPITQAFAANSAFALPPEAAGAHLIRLKSDATETAERTFAVTLKS